MASFQEGFNDPIEVEIRVNLRFNVSWKDTLKLRLAGATAVREYIQHLLQREQQFQQWLDNEE